MWFDWFVLLFWPSSLCLDIGEPPKWLPLPFASLLTQKENGTQMGMGQTSATKGPQALVYVSIYQGSILVHVSIVEPQPNKAPRSMAFTTLASTNSLATASCSAGMSAGVKTPRAYLGPRKTKAKHKRPAMGFLKNNNTLSQLSTGPIGNTYKRNRISDDVSDVSWLVAHLWK